MPESDTYTRDELVDILEKYIETTFIWDGYLNGRMDSHLEGIESLERRREIIDSFQWEHDIFTGQRMVVNLIKDAIKSGRLRESSEKYWSKTSAKGNY